MGNVWVATHLIRGEPERAPNTREIYTCSKIIVLMYVCTYTHVAICHPRVHHRCTIYNNSMLAHYIIVTFDLMHMLNYRVLECDW